MNHATIMKTAAAVALLFGVPLLLAPNTLQAIYQAVEPLNGPGIYNSMLSGAYLIGLAVINWGGSKGTAEQARPIILGTFVSLVLGLAAALVRQLLDSSLPPAAWVNVAIFLVLGGLYGYLLAAAGAGAARPTAA